MFLADSYGRLGNIAVGFEDRWRRSRYHGMSHGMMARLLYHEGNIKTNIERYLLSKKKDLS